MKITEKDSKPPFPGTRRGERQEPEPDGRATHVLPRDADEKVFTVCRLHSPALENRCLPAYDAVKYKIVSSWPECQVLGSPRLFLDDLDPEASVSPPAPL